MMRPWHIGLLERPYRMATTIRTASDGGTDPMRLQDRLIIAPVVTRQDVPDIAQFAGNPAQEMIEFVQ